MYLPIPLGLIPYRHVSKRLSVIKLNLHNMISRLNLMLPVMTTLYNLRAYIFYITRFVFSISAVREYAETTVHLDSLSDVQHDMQLV